MTVPHKMITFTFNFSNIFLVDDNFLHFYGEIKFISLIG
jgi:hypothetical protein